LIPFSDSTSPWLHILPFLFSSQLWWPSWFLSLSVPWSQELHEPHANLTISVLFPTEGRGKGGKTLILGSGEGFKLSLLVATIL
jgi:hypothetical protein